MTFFRIEADDLLPPGEYERVRRDRIASIIDHKAPRRVSLGTCLTVCFESRQSVLHQIQEVLHIEGPASKDRVARTIAEYDHLLPGPRALTATVFIDGGPPRVACRIGRAIGSAQGVLQLHVDGEAFEATCLDEPEHFASPVRYVRFDLSTAAVARLLLHGSRVMVALRCEEIIEAAKLGPSQRIALFENMKPDIDRRAFGAAEVDRHSKKQTC